jgi:Uma2 family endonuclease
MSAYRAPNPDRPLSIDEFEHLPHDEYRAELVRGWLLREPWPGPAHGGVAATLTILLGNHARAQRVGKVVVDAGFILAEAPPTIRVPDIAFIAAARIPDGLPIRPFHGAPDLAIEVVSPSNSRREMQAKVDDYLAAGTRAVWVVYPRTHTVVVHEPGVAPRTLESADELSGAAVLPGFRVRVGEVFDL